ncbi:MAG: hypothetical protein OFPI_00230 [Osedax symbiont Rs2]|nr:MAG: hypothetical protein OFPI_00230 [Osedax symbiont Rs2]
MRYLMMVLGVVVMLSAGVNYWQYQQQLKTTKSLAKAEKSASDRLQVITTLQSNAKQQAERLKSLTLTQTHIQQRLASREQLLRNLKNENKNYKRWADTQLPAITQRLQQRPLIIGADAYQQHLSNNDPLQPDAQQPPK